MKKKLLILLGLCFISFSVFSFEGIAKKSATKDGYGFQLYQIDKSEFPDSYEFYVRLTSNNSEEYFTWCYDNLKDALEQFKWLETINVVYTEQQRENAEIYALLFLAGKMTFEQAQNEAQKRKIITVKQDRRKQWRDSSYKAEQSGTYINYWIDYLKV